MKYEHKDYLHDKKSDDLLHTKSLARFRNYYEKLGQEPVQLSQQLEKERINFIQPFGRIIELGCHCGFISLHYAQKGFEVVGVDISYPLIDEANKRLSVLEDEAKNRCRFIVSDIESLDPKEIGHFDTIILTETLEHCIDPDVLVKKAKELMSDKSKIFISAPAERCGDKGSHLRGINKKYINKIANSLDLNISYLYQGTDKEYNILTCGITEAILTNFSQKHTITSKATYKTNSAMNIVGICRIRNEEEVIENTLKHLEGKIGNIYVYDDCSTDRTVEICKNAPNVVQVVENDEWESDPIQRQILEGEQRQFIYDIAKQENPDWIYYFDADEYVDFSDVDFERKDIDGYKMRFFDYYITPEDVNKNYLERKMIGPEYRDILTLFRPNPAIQFITRQPSNVHRVYVAGYVKHYGKAISVQQWEDTCDYYIKHLHEIQPGNTTIKDKWKERKGKAIHDLISDFDNFLIEWRDRGNQQIIVNNSNGQAEIKI